MVERVVPVDHELVIVGAGFGGIGVGIELERIGLRDFVILEEAGDLGGTWRDNHYPGLEVDIPSCSYSYSFEPYPHWSQTFAPGHEVKQYADHCADKYGIRPRIQFHSSVERIAWEDAETRWRIYVAGGRELTARFVVSAAGFLLRPKMPDVAGIERFAGKIMHTARWDHDFDLGGKRVAMIGTGATAVQVGPAIAARVAQLDVYQRTPIWLLPKPNRVFDDRTRWFMRRMPSFQKLNRAFNWFAMDLFFSTGWLNHHRFSWILGQIEQALIRRMRRQVHDPKVQEKLIPHYNFFCKRPSMSETFYPMFNRPNVELVTEHIDRITETGIATADGVHRPADVLLCATGYKIFDRKSMPTFEVEGCDGRNLGDWWQENRYQAFYGTTMPRFPNFFMLVGPYAASGASYFDTLSSQVAHISRCLRTARRRGARRIEVRQEAHDRDFAFVQRRGKHAVLLHGDCSSSRSYYLDDRGDAPVIRPVSPSENWLKNRLFGIPRNYHLTEH